MGNQKLTDREYNLLYESLRAYSGELSKVILTRQNWQWEKIKDSDLCGFKTEEDFNKWREDMNKSTKETLQEIDILQEKLENMQFGE